MTTQNSKKGSITVRRSIIAAAFAVSSLLIPHSCVTYYTVVPQIHPDGSMTRTVYAKADSACLAGDMSSNPFYFLPDSSWNTAVMDQPVCEWFLEDSSVLNFYAQRHFNAGDTSGQMLPASKEYENSPYLNPHEKWERRRGLFSDRYTYNCRFDGIGNGMPLPLDRFMSEEEIGIWLTDPGNLTGMNGMEIYNTMGPLMEKFTDWYNSCYIQSYCEVISRFAGDSLTATQREEVFRKLRWNYDFLEVGSMDDASIQKVVSAMVEVSGNQVFRQAAEAHMQQLKDSLEAIEAQAIQPMNTVLLYKVCLPGKLVSADTDLMDNGIPIWKIDGYRLLAGDVVIEATSRKARPLGFILTGAILLICVYVLTSTRKRI